MDGWDGPVHKLSSNENPYPPLPSVIAAMADAVVAVAVADEVATARHAAVRAPAPA